MDRQFNRVPVTEVRKLRRTEKDSDRRASTVWLPCALAWLDAPAASEKPKPDPLNLGTPRALSENKKPIGPAR